MGVGVDQIADVQPIAGADARGFFARFLKIMAVFDEFHAERTHGGVLLDAVSLRHVHRGR